MMKDIRHLPDEEKAKVYEDIDRLYHQGQAVKLKEHKSGFPALTLHCAQFRYLTDILSLEEWGVEHKGKHHHGPPEKEVNRAQGTTE